MNRNFGLRPMNKELSVVGRVTSIHAADTTFPRRARKPGRLSALLMGVAIGIMGTLYVIWAAGPGGPSW